MQAEWYLPRFIAHRGASARAPENTLVSVEAAHALGLDWVEFDVRLTKDLVPVIIHDADISFTTSGSGAIDALNLNSLLACDAGEWFGAAFKGQRVPTLAQMLRRLIALNMNANIELKDEPGREALLVEAVLQVVKDIWPKLGPQPLFSSFSRKQLIALRALSGDALLGFLMNVWDEDCLKVIKELSCVSVHVNHLELTESRVDIIKSAGFKVLAYTVDSPRRAHVLFSWGVDTVFTNCPTGMPFRSG